MATIIPFPNAMPLQERGLTRRECEALDAQADCLMRDGQATGVSIHNDGQFMCIYDCHGAPYFIGREDGICYLFDHTEKMVAANRRFEIVFQALETVLTTSPGTIN